MASTRQKRAVLIAALSAAALISLLVAEVVRSVTAKPGPPYDLAGSAAEFARAHLPEPGSSEDAWGLLLRARQVLDDAEQEALALLPIVPSQHSELVADYSLVSDPESGGWLADTSVRARVERRSVLALERFEALGGTDLLAHAAACPRGLGPLSNGAAAAMKLSDDLSAHRMLARATAARMRLAHIAANSVDLAAVIEQGFAIGRIDMQHPTVLSELSGHACLSLIVHRARELVGERAPAQPEVIMAALDRQRSLLPDVRYQLGVARLERIDEAQQLFTDNGRGGGRLIISRAAIAYPDVVANGPVTGFLVEHAGPLSNLLAARHMGKRATLERMERVIEMLLSAAELPADARSARLAEVDAVLNSGGFVLGNSMRVIERRAFDRRDWICASIDGLRLMLALESHRARTGAYPRALDELAPSVLPELPVDPYSGGAFRYIPPAEGETAHNAYVLYSVGWDGRDDGAMPHPEGLDATVEAHGTGYDFVLNRFRSNR